MPRKIIQVSMAAVAPSSYPERGTCETHYTAVCDDGTVWVSASFAPEWSQFHKPIPQD